MIAMTAETGYCRGCRATKPIAEFRQRSRSGSTRLNQCRTCHNEAERIARAKRRAKQTGKSIDRFPRRLKQAANPEEVAWLCGQMFRRFGGMAGFSEAWFRHYSDARPGSKSRTDMLSAFWELVKFNHSQQERQAADSASDFSLWTQEELKEELDRCNRDTIRRHPEEAIEAARCFGWTIIAPENLMDPNDTDWTI